MFIIKQVLISYSFWKIQQAYKNNRFFILNCLIIHCCIISYIVGFWEWLRIFVLDNRLMMVLEPPPLIIFWIRPWEVKIYRFIQGRIQKIIRGGSKTIINLFSKTEILNHSQNPIIYNIIKQWIIRKFNMKNLFFCMLVEFSKWIWNKNFLYKKQKISLHGLVSKNSISLLNFCQVIQIWIW